MGNSACANEPEIGDDVVLSQFDAAKLVTRAKAREYRSLAVDMSSQPQAVGHAGGLHSVLLLECCRNVPRAVGSTYLLDCAGEGDNGGKSRGTFRGRPFVRAWVEADGEPVGSVAEWPARPGARSPAWCSGRPLGVDLLRPGAAPPGATLRLELRDGDKLTASLVCPVSSLGGHELITKEMDLFSPALDTAPPCEISFQVLDSKSLCAEKRVVYFVRHGESSWNAAQARANVHELARRTDHPLSRKGQRQARRLQQKIAEASRRGEPCAAELGRAGAVYTSPLCRAVQTAALALGPSAIEASGEFVLMPAAREKQNLGGFDTMSSKKGSEVIHHAMKEFLEKHGADEHGNGHGIDALQRLRFDVTEAEEPWWCETNSEGSAQLKVRMQEFLYQLLYMPHQVAAVVGHSHFFRAVFKSFVSKEFAAAQPKVAKKMGTMKLQNCGVARVVLDPRCDINSGPIVDVQFPFGAEMDEDGASAIFHACCAQPGHTEEYGLTTDAWDAEVIVEDGLEGSSAASPGASPSHAAMSPKGSPSAPSSSSLSTTGDNLHGC